MDPTTTTLLELRDAIAAKKVSATEATRVYLDRIDRLNPKLDAYCEVYADLALEQAKRVDSGAVTGRLAGVPIALKDVLCTDYGHTSCSSKMLQGFAAPYTGTAVRRLEEAGAVILGKTNMDEFAMGSSTENSAFVTTKNPWDTTRVPGGSSGGSAAAMGADLCAASLGTDTGGSIRQPAALCNTVGIKPTYGRISRYGLIAFASSLDQIGPFTRTVGDSALLLKVMMGRDEHDSTSADVPVEPDLDDVDAAPTTDGKLRIGIAKQYMSDANDASVQRAMDEAIAVYKDAGAEIVEVDLPHTEYGIASYYIVAPAEASSNLARYDGVHYGHRSESAEDLVDLYSRSRAEGFGPEVKRRIMLGTYALSSGYYDAFYTRALKVRRLIKQDFDRAFDRASGGCHAILCPTTPGPAFKIGEKSSDPLAMYLNDVYTVAANMAGTPGISFQGGFTEVDGRPLPIGLQLLGPAFGERDLLRITRIFERATDYWKRRPAL